MTDLVVPLVAFLTTVAAALPAPRPSVCVAYNGKDTLAIPLARDGNNIFTMKLFLRDQWIDGFAVDTGSHSILVSGEDCQKCAQQGPKKTVVYTSQSSTVRVERIHATIEAHRFSCGGGGGRGVQPSNLLPTTSLCLNETDMNVALDFQGTSAYNVVGLGAHSSFLRSLMPSSARAFSMHIHSLRHAELFVFAPGQCFSGARRFPLTRRGIPLDAVNGARDATTRHVLLDTGSNALSLPEHVYAALPSRGTLRLTLGDFVLPVPFDKANVGNAQIMSSPGDDRIVVGVTFLVGFAIGGVQEQDGSAYVTIDHIND